MESRTPFLNPPKGPAPKPAPGTPPDGKFFAGIDKDRYPGDEVMQSLMVNTNLFWTGFYLTPAPSNGQRLGWMGKHDFLRGLGWGIAPIYVGRQVDTIPKTDHRITAANGTIDGAHAAQLALSARIAGGSIIYLDFENGPPLSTVQKDYYRAWATSLRSRGFAPGVYCLQGIAAGLAVTVPEGAVWGVNLSKFPKKTFQTPFPQPDPLQSGALNASLWQLKQQVTIEFDDLGGNKKRLAVDLNSSTLADPSGN